MRVVADSHAIVWYTQGSAMLSQQANEVLREAESTDGITISIATFVDLWYVTQTTKAITEQELKQLHAVLTEPNVNVEISLIDFDISSSFTRIPRSLLTDPWDRFIVATAISQSIPLVTKDGAITKSQLVETIW